MMRHGNMLRSANGLPDVKLGAFTQAVYDEAWQAGWTIVSMKDDWKEMFPPVAGAVMAIDILLEPNAMMLGHSADNNARLLKVHPKGSHSMRRTPRTSRCSSVLSAPPMLTSSMPPRPGACRRQRDRMKLEASNTTMPGWRGWSRGNLREADPESSNCSRTSSPR